MLLALAVNVWICTDQTFQKHGSVGMRKGNCGHVCNMDTIQAVNRSNARGTTSRNKKQNLKEKNYWIRFDHKVITFTVSLWVSCFCLRKRGYEYWIILVLVYFSVFSANSTTIFIHSILPIFSNLSVTWKEKNYCFNKRTKKFYRGKVLLLFLFCWLVFFHYIISHEIMLLLNILAHFSVLAS